MNWEEIHGFSSPNEFSRFVTYIEHQVNQGIANEVKPSLTYHKGEIYGGRWFKNTSTNETWRLVPPDFPFKGLWEPVCLIKENESISQLRQTHSPTKKFTF